MNKETNKTDKITEELNIRKEFSTKQLETQHDRDLLHNEEMRLKNNNLKNEIKLFRIEQARRNVEALGRIVCLHGYLKEPTMEAILKNIKVMNEVTEIK